MFLRWGKIEIRANLRKVPECVFHSDREQEVFSPVRMMHTFGSCVVEVDASGFVALLDFSLFRGGDFFDERCGHLECVWIARSARNKKLFASHDI